VTKQRNPKVYCVKPKRLPPTSQSQPSTSNRSTEKADEKLKRSSYFLKSDKPSKVVKIFVSGKPPRTAEKIQHIPEKVTPPGNQNVDDSTRPTSNFPGGITNASVLDMTIQGLHILTPDFSEEVAEVESSSSRSIENPRLPTPEPSTTFAKPLPSSFYRRKILKLQGAKLMKKSKILMYKCGQCGKVLTGGAQSLKSHMASHLNLRNHLCQTCGKTFNDSKALRRHSLTHGGEKKYLCDQCPMAFLQAGRLTRHLKTHTGEKPVVCDVCGMRFADNRRLKSHSVIHSEERPLRCTFCPKTFRRPDHLVAHTRIHTGIKPYKCDPCGKSWVQIGSLIFHNRTHHGIVKEKDN